MTYATCQQRFVRDVIGSRGGGGLVPRDTLSELLCNQGSQIFLGFPADAQLIFSPFRVFPPVFLSS